MLDQTGVTHFHAANRFETLVNAVVDYAIYMIDPDGRVATWNVGATRAKGFDANEIIGQPFSTFFTEEDRAAGVPEKALATAAAEDRYETEGWRVRKDGTRFYVHAVIDAIRNEAGELIGFAKITRDITEKKARESALFQSEQRFRLLVQAVRDYAIYMLDKDGLVTNWNPGAQVIKGYAEEEIVGRHFSQFYTPEDRKAGEPARALATALREGKYEREAWRVRKDGSLFWASVLIDPIFDDCGEHIGFAKVTRDVTERKRAEEELETTRAALAQSQKLQALGELTGGIAHDFNNLITVIGGSADLLQRDDLPPEKRRRYLQAIKETADRAAALTEHLLAFSRRQALRPEVIDLNVRIDALADVLRRTLGSRIEIVLDLASSLWPVLVDPPQLETALLNGAFNARDAMPDGGRLTIATANVRDETGEMVCLSIGDTGAGMSDEVLSRVFEPFFTTKPVGKGTGLGLSQIHGFAAQTGGRAEIASKPGKGTTLRLFLPRSADDAVAAARSEATLNLPSGTAVLVVEDNDQVRDFAEHLFEDLGCRVLTAASAEEALARLAGETVDLVFSDVVMPGTSGLELARRIREKWPSQPIVLATGYSQEMVGAAAAEFELVRKPYTAAVISVAASRAMTGPSAEANG